MRGDTLSLIVVVVIQVQEDWMLHNYLENTVDLSPSMHLPERCFRSLSEFDETSLSEYDEEERNVLYFNDLFPFNIIDPGDLKSEKDNDDNDIDIIQSSRDMALPPRDQRHQYLRREVHRAHVFDFGGLPGLMADGLSVMMLMEHRDALGVGFFTIQAWRRLFDIRGPLGDSARQILDKGDLRDYWIGISFAGDFLGTTPSYTTIQDLTLRLCHRFIACSIARRIQATEKVTMTDLFYLRGMDVGSFVARLDEHFGLLTMEILQGLTVISPALPVIDMAELVRLQICMEINDTWAWLALGPERQLDVAASALRVAQDAPTRMSRLEEDVCEIRGALTKQREEDVCEIRGALTITSLARMMDRAGVTYTSYSETPREYQRRRVRHRTGEAITSTA
ncbi:hypothetical protein Tco_0410930 [Tanacetum coccineum]